MNYKGMSNKKSKIEDIMENMEQPTVDVAKHQREFRLTLLNTKKSAITGVILLVLPFLFLSGVVLKHYMQIDFGLLTSVYEWIGTLDQKYGDHSILNWMIRVSLTIGPLMAIVLNLLSVTHIRFEKVNKELVLSFKLKWLNWTIISVCTIIFLIFFFYLLFENAWSKSKGAKTKPASSHFKWDIHTHNQSLSDNPRKAILLGQSHFFKNALHVSI